MELLCNIMSKLGRRNSSNILLTLSDRLSKEHFHTFIVTRHQFTFSPIYFGPAYLGNDTIQGSYASKQAAERNKSI